RLGRVDDRLVFVVGSPRSGTTMLAQSIGAVPGFVDLGEVAPLKAAVPELVRLPVEQAARQLRRVVERVRRLAAVRGLRCVEQTPEAAYLVDAIARAYPRARVVHIVRTAATSSARCSSAAGSASTGTVVTTSASRTAQ